MISQKEEILVTIQENNEKSDQNLEQQSVAKKQQDPTFNLQSTVILNPESETNLFNKHMTQSGYEESE